MSEHSVWGTRATQVGMSHNWAPPELRHSSVLWGSKGIRVQTGVNIEQRRAVCLPRGQRGHTNPVTVYILEEERKRNSLVRDA